MKVMDITKLAELARRDKTLPLLPLKDPLNEKKASLYAELELNLATFFRSPKEERLKRYCIVLKDFLAIANETKWLYLLLLDEQQIAQFSTKWQTRSLNVLYLILQQQVNKSYFERKSEPLVHAWHIFIKYGLVEAGFTSEQIEEKYYELYA